MPLSKDNKILLLATFIFTVFTHPLYRRLGLTRTNSQSGSKNTDHGENSKDYEIQERLRKLREDRVDGSKITDEELAERLKKIKGDYPTASEDEIRARLANLKGIPVIASINKVKFLLISTL